MTNQTTQILTVSLCTPEGVRLHGKRGWVCDLNPYGDYTALERIVVRENSDDDGTVIWQLTGPPHIKPRRLSALETIEAWGELFLQLAVDKYAPKEQG